MLILKEDQAFIWNQFLCLTFAQLTYRENLQDIVCCLRSMEKARLYTLTRFCAFFMALAKTNLQCRRLYSHPVDKSLDYDAIRRLC